MLCEQERPMAHGLTVSKKCLEHFPLISREALVAGKEAAPFKQAIHCQ